MAARLFAAGTVTVTVVVIVAVDVVELEASAAVLRYTNHAHYEVLTRW